VQRLERSACLSLNNSVLVFFAAAALFDVRTVSKGHTPVAHTGGLQDWCLSVICILEEALGIQETLNVRVIGGKVR